MVSIDAPTEKAAKLCERLQGKRSFELVYMAMNDLPDVCFDKLFAYVPRPNLVKLYFYFWFLDALQDASYLTLFAVVNN